MSINIKNAKDYIERFLFIKTKDSEVAKFKLNYPQQKLYDVIADLHRRGRPIRIIILKARQMGFSTLTEAVIFHRTSTKSNVNSMIIAHKEESTNNLFNMSKLYYEMLPAKLKPLKKASNSRELIFENPTKDLTEKQKNPGLRSKIKCATAGGSGVGRSDTFQNIHISEYAFWEGEKKITLNGLLQSVPNKPNTMVIIESTANGFDHYKEMWDAAVAGESDFTPVFFAWYELPEYQMPYNGFNLTDKEEKLKELYNLTNEQLAWRRWAIKNNCMGDENLFNQEYPDCPETAFLATGTPVFDNEKVLYRKKYLEKLYKEQAPLKGDIAANFNEVGDPIKGTERFESSPNGFLTIYKQPIPGRPYVIGGDTAEGGLDFSVAQVLDNITGELVATWRGHTDTDLYAKQMFSLGHYYNNALIAIETNFDLHPTKELIRLKYFNQYKRETIDEISKVTQHKFGFRTTNVTRPVIIGELVSIVRETPELINDVTTLDEMLVFVRNEDGRPEAQEGKHDDTVMAIAIAYKARVQQRMYVPVEKAKVPKDLPADLKHDLENDPEALAHWLATH